MRRSRSFLPPAPPHPSSSKRIVFTVAIIATPILFLLLLESSLRFFDYGVNLSLFVQEDIGGKEHWIMNPEVKSRYFTRTGFSPNMSTDYFRVPKPVGTYRIFCLGGSTTIGFPYGQSGSFAAFLRERLRSTFPQKEVEVINLGMTATNSFTVNDLLRDLEGVEPDLLVVYDGHNEFYGALGVASTESLGSRTLTKAYLYLIHFKTFQLLRNLLSGVRGFFTSDGRREPPGTMMERLAGESTIPFRSELYNRALDYFRENLEELRGIALERRIPLIVSTQVSNLRDQPPFSSTRNPEFTTVERQRFDRSQEEAAAAERSGNRQEAVRQYETALQADSMHAMTHYLLARNLDALGDLRRARHHYRWALDLDELRFRSGSDFNQAIKELGIPDHVFPADIEKIFQELSPDSIVGANLIHEHLHPTLTGYFLLAKALAAVMRNHRIFGTSEEWLAADTVADATHWNNRVTTSIDEWAAQKRIALLTSSFPFRPSEARGYEPPADQNLAAIVDRLVEGNATWEESHVRAAEYFESVHDHKSAASEYRALVHQLRYNPSAYYRLAALFAAQNRIGQAKDILLESLRVDSSSLAFQLLGRLTLEHDGADAALHFLEQAFLLSNTVDDRAQSGYLVALAHVRAGRPAQAIEPLEHALRVKPQFPAASELRARIGTKTP